MWFSLFALVLILAITFYQGLHGLFSSVIMCILTVLSAALAFGLYEDLYYADLGFVQLAAKQPDYGRAIAMMAIFIVSALVLSTAFDALIKGNLQFPLYVDRVGGGVFGFVTAMIVVGMLSLGFQMLPFGRTLLGFSRYEFVEKGKTEPLASEVDLATLDWSGVERRGNNVWLSPDRFTVALASYLSSNSLAGRTPLSTVYPKFVDNIGSAASSLAAETRWAVPANALEVSAVKDLGKSKLYVGRPSEEQNKRQLVPSDRDAKPGHRRIVLHVKLSADAREPKEGGYRFAAEQFRLLGREGDGGRVTEYFPVGISSEKNPKTLCELAPGQVVQRSSPQAGEFDLVFEIPDKPAFKTLFLEYKQNARVEVRVTAAGENGGNGRNQGKPAPTEESTGEPGPSTQDPGGPTDNRLPDPGATQVNPKGRVHVFNLAQRDPTFSDKLPFTLTQYAQGQELERSGSKVRKVKGLAAPLDNVDKPISGDQEAIDSLAVPEGMRLLQVSVEKLQPGSTYGQALDYARWNVKSIYLEDEEGRQHRVAGMYAIAEVGGKRVFELIYLDETERDFGHLPDFQRIHRRDLKSDSCWVLLFQIPPGCRPARLFTAPKKALDLRPFNLVAPE